MGCQFTKKPTIVCLFLWVLFSGVGALLNRSKIIMNYFRPLLPYFLVLLVLLSTSIFLEIGLINLLGQSILFILVVCIPIWQRVLWKEEGKAWWLYLLVFVWEYCLGLLDREFPSLWREEGKDNTSQIDAISQGLANASFLALPVFIIASNTSETFALMEMIGLLIWLFSIYIRIHC